MKNVLTGTACLLILLAMLLQFVHMQILYSQLHEVMDLSDTFRQTVRMEGCVSKANRKWLEQEIERKTGKAGSEVTIKGSAYPAARGEKVHYSVRVHLGDAVLAPMFLGSGKGSEVWYRESRWVASEYVKE